MTENPQFPVKWTAIEALNRDAMQFTIKSDVWSYGVLIWQICQEGEQPFKDYTNAEVPYNQSLLSAIKNFNMFMKAYIHK